MRRLSWAAGGGVIVLCALGLYGCGKSQPAAPAGGAAADAGHDHQHDHGHEGPHGGHIIEFGTEEHHAELTHDDESNRVGVYMLGPDAKTPKPIDAKSVTINVSVDGQPAQYELPAVPQPGDPEGQSSYFELVSEPLNVVVSGKSESRYTNARLNVTIDGKPYVGIIETDPHAHHDHMH